MKNITLNWRILRYKGLIICAVLFFISGYNNIYAQQAIVVSGGNASSTGQGSMSYTIGQIAYTMVSNATGSVIQGVQQPYEISVVNGLDNTNTIDLQILAYPNPVTDLLRLSIENFETISFSVQLIDMNGNLLQSDIFRSKDITIDMSQFKPSVYYLEVIENNRMIKTFKIIKN